MGNCWALLSPNECYCLRADENFLHVVKTDGKILEFRAPLLVKDVLVKFSTGSGIGLSKTSVLQQQLPLNYELKMGNVYYIIPSSVDDPVGAPTPSESNSSMAMGMKQNGVKRIKVVITKLELQQLLTKQLSVKEVLAGLEKRNVGNFVGTPRNWKPKLQSISEENE